MNASVGANDRYEECCNSNSYNMFYSKWQCPRGTHRSVSRMMVLAGVTVSARYTQRVGPAGKIIVRWVLTDNAISSPEGGADDSILPTPEGGGAEEETGTCRGDQQLMIKKDTPRNQCTYDDDNCAKSTLEHATILPAARGQ
eukprot:1182875-Prorocentrum_minimum.AAC.4